MTSSHASNDDPLSRVLSALGARSSGLTRLEAGGDWALAFPEKHRLKLVAVVRGTAWIRLPRRAPKQIDAGDVLLIGSTPYVIASGPRIAPVDGLARYTAQDRLRLGDGDDTVLVGAGIAFDGEGGGFLLDALPRFMAIHAASPSACAVRQTLDLLDGEVGRQHIGGARVAACLSEVLVVEAMRAYLHAQAATHTSWIGALGDRQIGAALTLMHGEVAHPWTVAELAARVGMSRSAFSSRFSDRVGQAPLHYLTQWRMLLARRLLADADLDIARIAERVGYQSASAFGHAFKRAFGAAPTRWARPRQAATAR